MTPPWIRPCVRQPCGNVGISLLYRPPSSPISCFDSLSVVLEDVCIPMFSNFLLIGDCNVDVSVYSSLYNHLFNVIYQHGLSVIPTGHTRITNSSATTIDLVLTTSPMFTTTCETIPPIGTSGHLGLSTTLATKSDHSIPVVCRRIWRYKHADFDHDNDLLQQIDPSVLIVDGGVNASWDNWQHNGAVYPLWHLAKKKEPPLVDKINHPINEEKRHAFQKI